MKRIVLAAILCCLTYGASAQQFYAISSQSAINAGSELVPGDPASFEYPFINLIKSTPSNYWGYGNGVGFPAPTALSADGMPLYDSGYASHSGWAIEVRTPFQWYRPGNYALTWTGLGDFEGIEEFSDYNGQLSLVSCTGSGAASGGTAHCSNIGCSTFAGYTLGTTLTVTTAPTGTGCSLQVGQPFSNGSTFASQFGTPTIITAFVSGSGGLGTYTINYSQTIGSSGSPATFTPGGRAEFSVQSGTERIYAPGSQSFNQQVFWNINMAQSGTSSANPVHNLAFLFTCTTTACPGDNNDEASYWAGEIAGTKFKQLIAYGHIKVLRDLGWAYNITNNLTTWATRKPTNYWQWRGHEMRASLYAGSTTQTIASPVTITASIDNCTPSCGSGSSGTTLNVTAASGTLIQGSYLDAAHVLGFIDDGLGGGSYDGVAGTTLTVTSVLDGTLATGQTVYDESGVIRTGTTISSGPTTCGANSCYVVSGANQLAGPTALTHNNGTPILNFTNIGVSPKTFIQSFISGSGSTGTYGVSSAQVVASESMAFASYENKVSQDSNPPVDKETVIVLTPSDSPNPSGNVFSADGGTTYYPLINSGATGNLISDVPVAGNQSTLVFDADLKGWLTFGGFHVNTLGGGNAIGLTGDVPPEVFLYICNELGMNPWITELYLGADPISDYTTQYALYIKSTYPSMVPEFETINEYWNAGTDSSSYLKAKTTVFAKADVQTATTTSSSSQGASVLHFGGSLPAYVKVGSTIIGSVNGTVAGGSHVTSINGACGTTGDVCIDQPLNNNVSSSTPIYFSWYAAANLGSASFGGVFNDDEGGHTASLLCQAVRKVYGNGAKCIDGLNTNGEGYQPSTIANPRLWASAYVGQNTSNLPIQSGCAGPSAAQTSCPAPFLQETAFAAGVTHISVHNYWQPAELGLNNGVANISFNGTHKEVADAYNFFYGNSTTQASIMASYMTTANNQYAEDTIANFNTYLYPATYSWATGCAGYSGTCGIKGMVAYEGSFSEILLAGTPNGQAAGTDLSFTVASVTNASPCVLNTVTALSSAYINDGGASGDGTAGNLLSQSASINLPMYGTITDAGLGSPQILGYLNFSRGNTYYLSASLYQAPTTLHVGANGAVAGMPLNITGNASYNGNYYAGTSPTQSAVSLYTDAGLTTPFDCTALGASGNLTVKYTGSGNYVNFLRYNLWAYSGLESYVNQMYVDFYTQGGGFGASQLDIASPPSATTAWSVTGNDTWGYWNVATSTSSSVSGMTLTLGGTITGRFQVGQTIIGQGMPPQVGATTPLTISSVGTFSGAVSGITAGDTFTLSGSPSSSVSSKALVGAIASPNGLAQLKGIQDYNIAHGN